MNIAHLAPIVGISGITSGVLHTQISSCIKPTPERPLFLTTNIITHESGREATYKTMSNIFALTPQNVCNIVRSKPKAPLYLDDMGIGVYATSPHCHGVRISFNDTSKEALCALRELLPKMIIVLDITPSAFQDHCEGKMSNLSALLSDFSVSVNAPIVNYAFIHINNENAKDGFILHDALRLVRGLMMKKGHSCRFGISGVINESIFGLISAIANWEELSIDACEGLRSTTTSELVLGRVHSFLEKAYDVFDTKK